MALVTVDKVATALNLKPRRVQQLAEEEGLPRESRGRYNLGACMAWYIRYLQQKLEERSVPVDGEYTGLASERARLVKAEADLKEMELAQARGQFVAIGDVEQEFVAMIQTTKARIMALAPRLAAELVGETSRTMIQARIEKAHKEALAHLAQRNGHTP